ncbi:hypothetical protein B0H10DRAFT_2043216 [Mycena sp. CBHHK59/15]|nr:hypothetical protein B0H10DRAFT_2043216 [Mycena sp. CBHHK59/15]
MARGKQLPSGPSALAQLLAHLRAPPKLTLPQIASLRLTLAARNDHFGARHFLKEQLPRIRYANPELPIEVQKRTKRSADDWRPEIELRFRDGKSHTLNLHAKWSSAILRELMDTAGSAAWTRWKDEAARTGVPLVPGSSELPTLESAAPPPPEPRFSFAEWAAQRPARRRRKPKAATAEKGAKAKVEKAEKRAKADAQAKASPAQVEKTPEQLARVQAKAEEDARKKAEEEARRKAEKKEARRARLDAPRRAEAEAEARVALELLAKPRSGAAAVLP